MTKKEQLIKKLFEGKCPREELEWLLDQLSQDEEDYGEIMEHLWQQLHFYPELEETTASAIVKRTMARIDNQGLGKQEPDAGRSGAKKINLSRKRLLQRISTAAVFLLLLGIVSWLWLKPATQVMVRTAFGQQKTIDLPDGSVLKLNANSSISFDKFWPPEEARQVWLEGEAYFEVQKKGEHGQKFQVITRDLTVEVLGTVFNVNTRKDSTVVFLEEGKVNIDLEAEEEDILMDPGEVVSYSRTTRVPHKRKAVEETPASWKDGTVFFKGKPLKEIIQKMEEIFGITATVENQTLLERHFNIAMPVDNVDTAYLVLKELTRLDIEKQGNQLIIK